MDSCWTERTPGWAPHAQLPNDTRAASTRATLAVTGETLVYEYDTAGYVTSRAGEPITWRAAGRLASFG